MESIYPRKRDVPKGYLDAVVGAAKRLEETQRVKDVVSAGNVEQDLRRAIEVKLVVST